MSYRYLYLHGFASSRDSLKGTSLRDALARDGVTLELPDLNVPSFEQMTYSDILGYLDGLLADTPGRRRLRLLGSSMGGYLAARWTERHHGLVERLVLLCPGFDLPSRWPLLLGEDEMARWQAEGSLPIEDADKRKRPLHWRFVEDARGHPAWPEVDCPVLILHGVRDEIVPVEFSRRYARERPHVRLVELDDDHALVATSEQIVAEVRTFLDSASETRP